MAHPIRLPECLSNTLSEADRYLSTNLEYIARMMAEDRADIKKMDKTIARIEKKLDQLEADRELRQIAAQQEQKDEQPSQRGPDNPPGGWDTPRTPLKRDISPTTSTPKKSQTKSIDPDELRHSVSKLSFDEKPPLDDKKQPFSRPPRQIGPLDPDDFPDEVSEPSPVPVKSRSSTKPLSSIPVFHSYPNQHQTTAQPQYPSATSQFSPWPNPGWGVSSSLIFPPPPPPAGHLAPGAQWPKQGTDAWGPTSSTSKPDAGMWRSVFSPPKSDGRWREAPSSPKSDASCGNGWGSPQHANWGPGSPMQLTTEDPKPQPSEDASKEVSKDDKEGSNEASH